MLGWGATSGFREDWTWDQAAETYALDADMAAKLKKANPQVGPAQHAACRAGHGLRSTCKVGCTTCVCNQIRLRSSSTVGTGQVVVE